MATDFGNDAKYKKPIVERPEEPKQDNEVRVNTKGRFGGYLGYVQKLFDVDHHHTVYIKGLGKAISVGVTVAEVIRRKIKVQMTIELNSIEFTEIYEPLEEGLDTIRKAKHVPGVLITLSLNDLDRNHPGYHAALEPDEANSRLVAPPRRGGGRGRGRGSDSARVHDNDNDGGEHAAEGTATSRSAGGRRPEREHAQSGESKDTHQAAGTEDRPASRGGRRRGGRGRGRGRGRSSDAGDNAVAGVA